MVNSVRTEICNSWCFNARLANASGSDDEFGNASGCDDEFGNVRGPHGIGEYRNYYPSSK